MTTRPTWLKTSVLAAACLGLMSACTPQTEEGACVKNVDCATGEVCTDGTCVSETPECTENSDCATGEVCTDGTCEPEIPECTENSDCATGEVCTDGTCVSETPECTENSDCATGEVCTDGTCGTPIVECTENSDCATGEVCTDGTCVSETPECTENSDCDAGEVCTDGTCGTPIVACTVDAECDDGDPCTGVELCTAGACQAGTPLDVCFEWLGRITPGMPQPPPDEPTLSVNTTCNVSGATPGECPNDTACSDDARVYARGTTGAFATHTCGPYTTGANLAIDLPAPVPVALTFTRSDGTWPAHPQGHNNAPFSNVSGGVQFTAMDQSGYWLYAMPADGSGVLNAELPPGTYRVTFTGYSTNFDASRYPMVIDGAQLTVRAAGDAAVRLPGRAVSSTFTLDGAALDTVPANTSVQIELTNGVQRLIQSIPGASATPSTFWLPDDAWTPTFTNYAAADTLPTGSWKSAPVDTSAASAALPWPVETMAVTGSVAFGCDTPGCTVSYTDFRAYMQQPGGAQVPLMFSETGGYAATVLAGTYDVMVGTSNYTGSYRARVVTPDTLFQNMASVVETTTLDLALRVEGPAASNVTPDSGQVLLRYADGAGESYVNLMAEGEGDAKRLRANQRVFAAPATVHVNGGALPALTESLGDFSPTAMGPLDLAITGLVPVTFTTDNQINGIYMYKLQDGFDAYEPGPGGGLQGHNVYPQNGMATTTMRPGRYVTQIGGDRGQASYEIGVIEIPAAGGTIALGATPLDVNVTLTVGGAAPAANARGYLQAGGDPLRFGLNDSPVRTLHTMTGLRDLFQYCSTDYGCTANFRRTLASGLLLE